MELIRLKAPELDFWVDVRLVHRQGRWLAVATISGDAELGLGNSPAGAVREALRTLGDRASSAFVRALRGSGTCSRA